MHSFRSKHNVVINVVTQSAVTTRETVNGEGGVTKREGYCENHDAQELLIIGTSLVS
jgi:hypothetical protein